MDASGVPSAVIEGEAHALLGSPIYPEHDFREPDFDPVYQDRSRLLTRLVNDPDFLDQRLREYAKHPLSFIRDWAMTYDPRNALKENAPTVMPMVLFAAQERMVEWVFERMVTQERGLVDKSRDCGATWLVVWVCIWCLFFLPGSTIGFGSRKQEYIDQTKNLKAFFQRVLWALDYVPDCLKPTGFDISECYSRNRIANPHIGSYLVGEAGENIGRGDRTTATFVDEKASMIRGEDVNRALLANTDCHIDISTPGNAGDFYFQEKQRFVGTRHLFVFDYSEDPRKVGDWQEKKQSTSTAREFGIEYGRNEFAGDDECIIQYDWLLACVDAHEILGFLPVGPRIAGFDPSDTGDAKAFTLIQGSVVLQAAELHGGNHHIGNQWAFSLADQMRADVFGYDADGLGTGVPNDRAARPGRMPMIAFKSQASPRNPASPILTIGGSDFTADLSQVPKNAAFHGNARGQAWWNLKVRAYNTWVAVTARKKNEPMPGNYRASDFLSISSAAKDYRKLCIELAIPRTKYRTGRFYAESKQEMRSRGVRSPNLADSAIIASATQLPREQQNEAVRQWLEPEIMLE